MPGQLVLLLLLAALAAGCAQKVATPQGAVYLRRATTGATAG